MTDIPSWCRVGAKVVCVDADASAIAFGGRGSGWEDGEAPVRGTTYTIARVWIDFTGSVVVEFLELKRHPDTHQMWGEYCGYHIGRFRPLISKNQSEDVAAFKHLLNTVPSDLEGV